jgi:Xaa-Pro dipeptidase
MILYHTTAFGTAERQMRSAARAQAAARRIGAWLAALEGARPAGEEERPAGVGERARSGPASQLAGLVLTGPAAVAWACGGVAPPVDRTAAVDLVWAVFTRAGAALITTNVEADRIRAEYGPAAHGFTELVAVPWQDPGAFVTAAAELAGAGAGRLAADGHPAFGLDASDDLIALRLALSEPERADLADLGEAAAGALQSALTSWRPGERDLDIQARCAAQLEAAGADVPVLIVGGDERLARYRHPMAVGAPVSHLVMAVVVARRGGLHVATTRFATAAPLDAAYLELRRRVLAIEDAVLSASQPGATYGTALAALDAAYARASAPGEWAGHYQGGPIGFAQREFELAPGQHDQRWYRQPIEPGQAIAWNPSLPGGAKAEDTYLVTAAGELERVTQAPGWPAEPDDGRRLPRPAVLEVGT